MKKRGISLIVLVITIIVIAILATAVIVTLFNTNTLDQSKKAKFMSDYRTVQEGVNLFSLSRFNAETNEFELPLKGYLTEEDKTYITENVPTLKTKIEELSGTIDTVNLAWISSEDIGVKLSSKKTEKGYILDVLNGLVYDYNGDYFEGQMWHTLDGGVLSNGPSVPGEGQIDEELWDGWIKLTLYYPPNSTSRQWRLGIEGELRADPMLMWQNYTGPITIPLDRVKDVWIKYKIDNKEVVIPPAGTLLVDIVPDKTGYTKVPGVKVHINFDETATLKEYRIGDSGWITYTGEFNVTENCIIEARARKTETIYNTDGTELATRNIAGRDLVYIGNIGVEETELSAPTITRLPAVGAEKARVQVTYPANANKKVYKINYGIEENYETEIDVQNYGTYIIAYYYDASGKRSKSASIRINDTSTGTTPEPPGPYYPRPPREPGNPVPPYNPGPHGINIPAPTVVVNPTSIAEEVQVSINAPENSDMVYIKLGRYGIYQLYTRPIIVKENMDVYAYYRTYIGERSDTGYGRVSNIKKNNKPYVRIDADPYPYSWSYGVSEVNITIDYIDATTIEYSEDGVLYTPYITPFKVTQNKTIYARAVNSYGITETSLNITNIGKIKPPTPMDKLSVGINVNPEPTVSTTRYTKASVSIDYDSKATEKYYRIGKYGELKPYTGTFDVTTNCTIYAYAKGTNSTGSISKRIDNLSDGIAEPVITTEPGNSEKSSKVLVTIEYDKYATIKRYSINGESLRDYVAPFEVTKNESVIYAYSENDVGQESESSYIVNNIIQEPPVLLLDKGQYYILKLNYPEGSKNREYKWKENGTWGQYKDAGILLLKPQYKDQLIQNGTLVKIEDETGKLVTFTGDYYFIDVPISELFENLFMRWDREPLGAPQIVITPTEASMQVKANIAYNSNLIKKLYKVVNPDGSVKTDWTDYTGSITIDRNNSIVYAKGMDDTEVWTIESMKRVTNIDENQPIIKLTADLDIAQQKVAVKVTVTDDVGIGKIKWSTGIQGENYFTNSGTEIQNNSIVNITSNGYYTFYAEDQVGNKQIYTLNVTNVDLTAPAIDITVNPESTVGLTANITIDYGDSVTKQYKVGTSNLTWNNYTTTFEISAYTILSNNWQNEDGTVTIYAKGKDSANNEVTVQKKVLSLDLDKPKTPVITSNAGYPLLTSYGVVFDSITTITYDTRTDIDNYYSIDGGTTWAKYNGTFDFQTGTIIAKSVKKDTGLEVAVSKSVIMPSDAIGVNAYDGNYSTYDTKSRTIIPKLRLDKSIREKRIRVKYYMGPSGASWAYGIIEFYDESGKLIQSLGKTSQYGNYDSIITVPSNAAVISVRAVSDQGADVRIYEIQPANEPTFNAKNGYMLLHSDPTKSINKPYQMVTIDYFPTSVQRLYKIGTTDEWKEYQDKAIWVNQGETLYTKGIDQYGNETRIISSHTANTADAIGANAYDGNYSTYDTKSRTVVPKINLDPIVRGKRVRVRFYMGPSGASWAYGIIEFYDESGKLITSTGKTSQYGTYDSVITIPSNAAVMSVRAVSDQGADVRIYEIEPNSTPVITVNPTTPTNESVTVKITKLVPTYTTQYSFDGKTWEVLEGDLVLTSNATVYAKSIFPTGGESSVTTLTINNIDKISPNVVYGTNGAGSVKTASTKVTITDTGTSGVDTTTLQYVWDRQNVVEPADGWTAFSNGATLTKTNEDEIYYLWVKASDKAGNSVIACSNSFGIDNTSPDNPTVSATPTDLTNGNVTVTITYPSDANLKQYSTNGTSWSNYTVPVTITSNLTLYARAIDIAGNQSGATTITIANIDKTGPVVEFGTNGNTNVNVATTSVLVTDSLSGVEESSLQYVWSTSTTAPTSGWASFTNGDILSQDTVTGSYYLWIKAADKLGNVSTTRSTVFKIDNTAPTVPTIATVYVPNTMTNCTVTVTYPSDATKKEYSYDGENWQTYTAALNVTTDSTIYVRATDATGNVSEIGTRNIYILGGSGYIPTMTSDTTPSPFVVTSSSQYASAGHEKYRAFDKTLSTVGWASAANDVNDGAWIQIKLDQAITISKYYITARNDMNVDQSLKAWQLQGSNDGSNWDILDSQTNQVGWSLGELRRYNVNTTNSYQYYRLYITESNGSIHVTIDEMNIYQ